MSKLATFIVNSYKYYSSGVFLASLKKGKGPIFGSYEHTSFVDTYDPFEPLLPEKEYMEIESSRLPILIPNSFEYDALPLIQKNFQAIKAMSDAIGAKLLVVIIPDEMQVNRRVLQSLLDKDSNTQIDIHYPQKRITDVLQQEHIPYLDLLEDFEKDASPSMYYQPQDTHFNSYGNARAAQLMYPLILKMLER